MADNYLEKQMADYRAGKFATRRVADALAARRPASPVVGQVVFVIGGCTESGRAAVTGFRNGGCRVAFCDSDRRAGSRLAQESGAQFHPIDPHDDVALARSMMRVASAWAPIDIVVDTRLLF